MRASCACESVGTVRAEQGEALGCQWVLALSRVPDSRLLTSHGECISDEVCPVVTAASKDAGKPLFSDMDRPDVLCTKPQW